MANQAPANWYRQPDGGILYWDGSRWLIPPQTAPAATTTPPPQSFTQSPMRSWAPPQGPAHHPPAQQPAEAPAAAPRGPEAFDAAGSIPAHPPSPPVPTPHAHQTALNQQPSAEEGTAPASRKRGCGMVIGALAVLALLLIVVAAVFGNGTKGGDSTTAPDPSTAPAPAAPAAPQPGSEANSRSAADGMFQFTVNRTTCGRRTVGQSFMRETAQGEYCIVNMTVRNTGDEPRAMFSDNQYAFNGAGQQFSPDTGATMVIDSDSLLFKEINPGNQVTGNIVYDVPRGTKLVRMEVHDSMFSDGASLTL